MNYVCAHCGATASKAAGHVNRARERGLNLYCNRVCSGLGRRKPPKTKAQKVAEKRDYDMEYRRKNSAMLKAKKAAYHKSTYDSAKARVDRKKRSAAHAEYCTRPEYRRWKREYDRKYRAKEYGPFAEAYELTVELNREIKTRTTNYEIRQQNKTNCKAQNRDRKAEGPKRSYNYSPAHG